MKHQVNTTSEPIPDRTLLRPEAAWSPFLTMLAKWRSGVEVRSCFGGFANVHTDAYICWAVPSEY